MRRTTFRRRLVRTFALCLGMTGIFVSAAVAQVVDAEFPTMDTVKQFSFQPDTAPTATVAAPTVAPISNPGFDWGDAGIGAAIALALAAMLIAGWRTLNRRPDQPAGV